MISSGHHQDRDGKSDQKVLLTPSRRCTQAVAMTVTVTVTMLVVTVVVRVAVVVACMIA